MGFLAIVAVAFASAAVAAAVVVYAVVVAVVAIAVVYQIEEITLQFPGYTKSTTAKNVKK